MNPFIERHRDQIAGVLSCFDRVIVTGTLPDIAHAEAMVRHLNRHLFDQSQWAEPLRDEIRRNAERLSEEAGLEIEFVRRLGAFRKEARIKFQLPDHLPPQTAMTLFELFSELTNAIWQQYETDLVKLIIAERHQPPDSQPDLDFDDDIFLAISEFLNRRWAIWGPETLSLPYRRDRT